MKIIMPASAASILALAFANSNAGSKLYIGVTIAAGSIPKPQNDDLDDTGFAALLWTQIKGVGDHGQTGLTTNFLNYPTWDTTVQQKAKGIADAGSPTVEVARIPSDPGQIALRAAALTNQNYAFKIERNDKPDNNVGSKPSIFYNRGLVSGPAHPLGRNEDFDLEVFTLAFNQAEVVANPVSA